MATIDIEDIPNQWDAIMAKRPEVATAWRRLESTLHTGASSTLPLELKENARIALSEHVGCRFCSSFGVLKTEGLTRPEQLAIDFARKIATDHRSIDQATFDELKEEFSDEQILELTAWLCFKLGANVLGAITQLTPAPDTLRAEYDGVVTFMLGQERERNERKTSAAV